MKAKNKPTRNPCEKSLIVTPLSLTDCISKIEEMANFDLKVSIKWQSKIKAEVNFVQRQDYDHPIYTTSQLIATKEGICVTFDGGKPTKTDKTTQVYFEMFLVWVSRLVLGVVLIHVAVMAIREPRITPLLFFVLFVAYGLHTIKVSGYRIRQTENFDNDHMTESMLKRSASLKASLYNALYIDPSEVYQDELGNEYFVDTSHHQKGNFS